MSDIIIAFDKESPATINDEIKEEVILVAEENEEAKAEENQQAKAEEGQISEIVVSEENMFSTNVSEQVYNNTENTSIIIVKRKNLINFCFQEIAFYVDFSNA